MGEEENVLGRAKFSFQHRHDDEIDIKFNDIVRIVQADCGVEGWCEVEFHGKIGKVPSGYIQTLANPYHGSPGTAQFAFSHPKDPDSGQFLSFEAGDEILVIDRPSTGWCVGILKSHIGLFPEHYVTFSEPSTYAELEEIIMTQKDNEYKYATTLCNAVDVSATEALARDLILIFEKHDKVFDLICSVIDNEVQSTLNEGTLFRKNSLSSHLMSQYARLVGKDYLAQTLRPLICGIINSSADYEIDPHKISDPSKLEKNVTALKRAAQDFLLDMMSSVSKFPVVLRKVCQYLQKSVVDRFPNARRKVVGGFFFLRLICPAVVSPEGFGVVDKVDDTTRRSLILISKIMQTLSNGVMFGVKEAYMKPMNQFITQNLENSHFLLDKLATVHPDATPERLDPLTEEEENDLFARIHIVCSLCKSKFLRSLKDENVSTEEIRRIVSIIIRLGPTPKKKPKPVAAAAPPGPQRADPAAIDKKRIRAKEKEREKEEKREKKQREKEKKIQKAATPAIEPPAGRILVKSVLQPKNNRQLRKRVYALYSASTKIYSYNSPDDHWNNFIDTVELAPSYEVSLVGRTKNGWEFSIRTLEREYGFISVQEEDMRSWVAYLDRRKKEIMMPDADKQQKLELLGVLEAKMKGYEDDKNTTKQKIKEMTSDDPDPTNPQVAGLARHVEELVIMMETLQRTIDATKASLR